MPPAGSGPRCRHERDRRRSHGGDAYPDLP